MNLLSKRDVFAENKLFATLDTTTSKVVFETTPFLLSDTGAPSGKLPHHLVESFKSTLDEVRESDILLHVVDVSHPAYEEQIAVVNKTLHELDAHDKPVLTIFNKMDLDQPTPLTNGWKKIQKKKSWKTSTNAGNMKQAAMLFLFPPSK